MPRPARTEYALLGLIAMGPKSGYDIKREVEEVLSHFWNESYGNIYPTLARLDRHGLLERWREPGAAGPPRYMYRLTSDGEAELRRWLAKPVERRPPRNELLLKVFFGRFVSRDDLARVVRHYRDETTDALARLEAVAAELDRTEQSDPSYPYWRMTIDLGVEAMHVVVRWAEDALERIQHLEEAQ